MTRTGSPCFCSKEVLHYDRTVRRCFEISKARIVAVSHLANSMQSIAQVGMKKGGTLQEATERTAYNMMYRGLSPSVLPWLIADTLDHLFRTDLLLLIQYFCQKLEVPNGLAFQDVLIWLRCYYSDGLAERCGLSAAAAQGWKYGELLRSLQAKAQRLAGKVHAQLPQGRAAGEPYRQGRAHQRALPQPSPPSGFEAIAYGLFAELREAFQIAFSPVDTKDSRNLVLDKMAPFIYHDGEREFNQYCHITRYTPQHILSSYSLR